VANIRPADSDLSKLLKAASKTLQRVIFPVLSHNIEAIHRVPALPSIPVVREGSELKPGAYEYIKSSGGSKLGHRQILENTSEEAAMASRSRGRLARE
jgi:hypothetical protein